MRRLLVGALLVLVMALAARAEDQLASGFQNPPDSAKPQTWWHWMNGNVTKEGITADLEAMKRVGIGGAEIFVVDEGIPPGKASFLSPQFIEMIKHAASEADRLGLELCFHNCAGWSSSGGPWNTPEHSMQFVQFSETHVKGPAKFSDKLQQPPTQLNFYRDIAVLAYPAQAPGSSSMGEHHPKITTNIPGVDAAALIDGNPATEVVLPKPTPQKPEYIQIELDQPVSVRTVSIVPGKGMQNCTGEIQASDDGNSFHAIRTFALPRNLARPMYVSFSQSASGKFFRIVFDNSGARTQRVPLAEIDLTPRAMIDNVQEKAGFQVGFLDVQTDNTSPDLAIKRSEMVDLTDKLDADGKLIWNVPDGDWTILRVGYSPTGKTNHPAPPEATGPECDKFSKEALDAHWAGYAQKLLDAVGPLAGKSLNDCLIDSYEVGGQNWTPKMKQEFQKRRGYDLTRFLPAMSGHVVDNPQISDRFLWDLRRTIADLFAENYYGHFAELCHAHGLKASLEPYTGPFESLQSGKPADIVMGEFWTGSQGHPSIKLAASVAHIYGKTLVGAESFTSAPPLHGRWQETPWSLKALGDLMYCQGINRFIFHRYAMQPWLDKYPGMTMGQWGFHMDRTNTWFDKSTSWLKYVARCQYLLQQGRFFADVAYFDGESAPVESKIGDPPMPRGFDFDEVNKDVLMQATVKDGRVVLPSGTSYAVLVLPQKVDRMTPEFAAKIRDLAKDGATIIGPKPTRSPSLQDYPRCDDQVRQIADQAWGTGEGKISSGISITEAMAGLSLKPDFETPTDSRAKLAYIHRVAGGDDIYFVSNQRDGYSEVNCTFRVSGKVPQLWHPDSGMMERAPVYSEADGRTTVPLQFEPSGSVFVVFRKADAPADHIVEVTAKAAQTAQPVSKIVIQHASYEASDNAGAMDVTEDLKKMVQAGMDDIAVSNSTFGQDPAYLHAKQLRVEYSIDGKPHTVIVRENENFRLDTVGASTEPPYTLTTTSAGDVQLLANRSGSYDLKLASGKTRHVDVPEIAKPLEITGAWELRFPPNWGAPDKVTLDKLISWTDHPQTGVKYFSGTATYLKPLDISADMLGQDRILYLDLGEVKNLAQVKLNGKDLGILWKPPFRVNISDIAHAGKNDLEVHVTNLWPNRLIGDEQKPADVEWNGMKLARWPQWLLDGKPSPTGRLTFTTWHHWTKDMQPLRSGLLGPVKLEGVQRIKLD